MTTLFEILGVDQRFSSYDDAMSYHRSTKEQTMPSTPSRTITRYRARGELTNGGIPPENLSLAINYLHEDDMTQFVDGELKDVIIDVRWDLIDGEHWQVSIIAARELTPDESKKLSEWISGQNSDGLGEGFEQQDFAWASTGYRDYADIDESEDDVMVSFDWETNDCALEKVGK